MKIIFRVNVKIPEYRDINLYFDEQERAERLILAIQKIMSKDGLKKVKFEFHKEAVMDSDQDILDALKSVHLDNIKKEDLKESEANQFSENNNTKFFNAKESFRTTKRIEGFNEVK